MKHFLFFLFFTTLLFLFSNSINAQTNLNYRSLLAYNHTANEEMSSLWGYSVAGNDYIIAGSTAGTSIVNVTNPNTPVEILFVPGPNTYWREVKVWGTYAYIVNEQSNGVQIINLASLPTSAPTISNVSYWTGGVYQGNNITINTVHTIWIDENGIAYLFGYNSSGGALMLNLVANPTNPPIIGRYSGNYIHDGFVRGDTLWAAHINDGFFSVINVANKTNPVVLAQQNTSSNFSHNIAVTNDGHYAFTTDETSGSYIDAYDVSDLNDIQLVGQFRRTTTGIQHNVHLVQNKFAVIAAYRDGVTVIDVSHPERMIEVGNYDTAPSYSGNGFNGCWGVYPYFPSNKMSATDIEEGLYTFAPTYIGACFLEGIVTNSATGALIQGASIQVTSNTGMNVTSDFAGHYLTGNALAGTYTITVSKLGFSTQTFTVTLTNDNTFTLNVALVSTTGGPLTLSGQIINATTSTGISTALVTVVDASGMSYNTTASATGNYSISLPSGAGIYSIYAGKWGFITNAAINQSISAASNVVNINLMTGYYDDFLFNFGWTVTSNATVGAWVKDEPFGTTNNGTEVNPENDLTTDYGNQCYVTANPSSTSAGSGDVDNGSTVLTSPVFDLSTYSDPHIKYSRWFHNSSGNTSGDDQMLIKLTNGTQTVTIETIVNGDIYESQWHEVDVRIADYIPITSTMRVIADIGDLNNQHLVEGGLDGFSIEDNTPPTVRVQAKVYLAGCYDPTVSLMRNILRASNLIPIIQPYNIAPFNYLGTEQVNNISSLPTNMVDWVLLEAYTTSNTLVERRAGWLLQDGTIVDLDNNAGLSFNTLIAGNTYRLLIRHRNHLAVIGSNSITVPNLSAYDFTNVANIQGTSLQVLQVSTTSYGLFPTDANANGIISYTDYNRYATQANTTNVYSPADMNLDGNVNITDFNYYQIISGRIGEMIIRY